MYVYIYTMHDTVCYIQEAELMTLYRAIVEEGPDMFSLHRITPEAPFR